MNISEIENILIDNKYALIDMLIKSLKGTPSSEVSLRFILTDLDVKISNNDSNYSFQFPDKASPYLHCITIVKKLLGGMSSGIKTANLKDPSLIIDRRTQANTNYKLYICAKILLEDFDGSKGCYILLPTTSKLDTNSELLLTVQEAGVDITSLWRKS